ncbi:hypothetical protein RFI_00332 [Reticulomyxa filosa]|uniref:Kelch motif family protein n=1 Tax=Reticulomyxa filosa TaxID=46433 RepID=X6PDY5_RETFI|nr:hypothetical protein RFI_00332 [Reticulomyxa filosa]|eukprot:ETO36730.1 hypothetical protein RFI_00332 [Reticulomyxa filosa]
MGNQAFQILKELPTPLHQSQCVPHKHELLICGGKCERACYSYHTLKNEYKFICDYPSNVLLDGHCVVKLMDNNNNSKNSNEITLLSFGGYPLSYKHTLVMKYVSVWNDISNKSNELNNYNQWIPFTDNNNHPIVIGKDECHYYLGMRATIGGSNNHLLFITHFKNNISVFDLNTFQFIKHDTIPGHDTQHHCFILNSKNGQLQEMAKIYQKKNKQNYQMLLFKQNTGLSIEYDEDNKTFQFHELPVCEDIASFFCCAYVCINDVIFFFGGLAINKGNILKSVHKYSIRENKWLKCQNTLPCPLHDCIAISSEEDNYIHIIGGLNRGKPISTHMKTKVRVWDPSQLSKKEIICIIEHWNRNLRIKLGWVDDFNQIIVKYKNLTIKTNIILFNKYSIMQSTVNCKKNRHN